MLKTIDGEIVSLADFRGKVIHVSFWASWCNPCLQQVKYIKEIHKELDPEEMVFLYISIDEKEDAWRNMVAKKELVGVQVLSKGLKSLKDFSPISFKEIGARWNVCENSPNVRQKPGSSCQSSARYDVPARPERQTHPIAR